MDKIGQYGQNWSIRAKLYNMDNSDKIGQNWTIWTKLDKIGQYG